MKTIVCLGIVGALLQGHVRGSEHVAWRWELPIQVAGEGLVRVKLPPEFLDVAKPDLGDLRVVGPNGKEAAYVVEGALRRQARRIAQEFRVTADNMRTVIACATRPVTGIEAIELVSPASAFLKSVDIEARPVVGEWRMLAENEVIFRQADGAGRMKIPIPVGEWVEWRITVDDMRSAPVAFTEVALIAAEADVPARVVPAKVTELAAARDVTRLRVELGARNLDVLDLRWQVSDRFFSRSCGVFYPVQTIDGRMKLIPVADQQIFRTAGEGGQGIAEDVDVTIGKRIPARELEVHIRNGDNPPLEITGVEAVCFPTSMVFQAVETGTWTVMAGHPGAKTPVYDLVPLRASLADAKPVEASLGKLRENPDFQAPPQLPDVAVEGAEIDPGKWNCRRPVEAKNGIIRIELDEIVLAACRRDLGDVRLVREGRQLPYLVHQDSVLRTLGPLEMKRLVSGKIPKGHERWEVRLPVDGLPVKEILAESSARVFQRRFTASAEWKDERGNASLETVGSADWTQPAAGGVPLIIYADVRFPKAFLLETDHGENQPVPLENVKVRYLAPVLVAKVADADGLALYYGNPDAKPPSYDLRLVRDALMSASPTAAELGPEEMLSSASGRRIDAGSPWLWVALAGVVIILLVIIARLLPKPEAG